MYMKLLFKVHNEMMMVVTIWKTIKNKGLKYISVLIDSKLTKINIDSYYLLVL